MRTSSILSLLLSNIFLCAGFLSAKPTQQREWTSTAGTKLLASALEIDGSEVVLKRDNGSVIRVPLDKLIPKDQAALKKHFTQNTPAPKREKPDDLPHPQGQVVGPIQAKGAKYFLYLPKTLVKDRLAPLMFFTGAGGGNAKHVARYTEGAEVNGWIVAASVESKNGRDGRPFVKACIQDIKDTLPVDPERFYFTGGSGGAVFAMINCETYKGAGAMPFIAHGIIDKMPSKKGHYYFVNGATDYNRYGSAFMRKAYKDHAFQRFHPGGHFNGPNFIAHDGMAWLNGKYLAENADNPDLKDERLDYEKRMIAWAQKLKSSAPHRALLQLDFLTREYEITGNNVGQVEKIKAELSQDSKNTLYLEAIFEIDEFSQKYFSGFGGSSKNKHTSKNIQKAAAALESKYQGVPEVEETLKNLQKPSI